MTIPHAGGIYDIAFSNDGRLMAAGVYESVGDENTWNVLIDRVTLLEEIDASRGQSPARTP